MYVVDLPGEKLIQEHDEWVHDTISEWTVEHGISCEYQYSHPPEGNGWPTYQYSFYKKADATAFKLKWA